MYQNVLVPLDGSPLSEEALPLAVSVAKASKAKLILVRAVWVLPLEEMRSADLEIKAIAEAEKYLDTVAARVLGQGVEVETCVPFMPAGEGILLEINLRHADLVVMSTHGRSGLSRLVFGSVAEAIVLHSPVPVLLVRSQHEQQFPATLSYGMEILTPLDGSLLAETALPYAEELARVFNGTLVLMRIVDLPPQWVDPLVTTPYPTQEVFERLEADAKTYLETISATMRAKGLKVRTVLVAGIAANCLLDECDTEKIRLVVMATHGRTGFSRAVFGSVALRVLHQGHLPLVLVRPQGLVDALDAGSAVENETSEPELTHT